MAEQICLYSGVGYVCWLLLAQWVSLLYNLTTPSLYVCTLDTVQIGSRLLHKRMSRTHGTTCFHCPWHKRRHMLCLAVTWYIFVHGTCARICCRMCPSNELQNVSSGTCFLDNSLVMETGLNSR